MPVGGPPNPNPVVTGQAAGSTSNTNPDGSFNTSGAANSTDPATTGTDVYGLSPSEEGWTFYLGNAQGGGQLAQVEKQIAGHDKEFRQAVTNPGQQYQTALQLMQYYSGLGTSPNKAERQEFANMQQQLLAIGAYGNSGSLDSVRLGVWTDLDAQALIKAFKSYQQVAGPNGAGQPITFSEYLDQAAAQSAANGQAGGVGNGAGSSAPILADVDTLTRYAQMAAKNALGRALTSDELNKFVSEFHSQQVQSYTDAAGHNGLAAVKDDPRSSAINFVSTNNPQEFAQNQAQGYTDAFLNMFLPSSSAAPNVSVDPTAIGL